MEKTPEKSATTEEIRQILGSIDDEQLMSILATGATAAEVMEAFEWLSGDDRLGTDLEHTRRGRVGAVYEILARDIEEEDR
ncbi:MAG TPA: hypothetical protein VN823_20510 [Stellaceae bacterium]|nr:hypothetical protein [Stellaceae bacterium]